MRARRDDPLAAGRIDRLDIRLGRLEKREVVAQASSGVAGTLFVPPQDRELHPGGLEDFVDLVVPELQKRGLFRIRYEGRMLRTNLGLST